mgnify:CR=1 FL=1|tara:strand:- start:303 stop:527 length:225 start_codon:yes stop_codon:yes gene_type:complete
MKNQIVKALHKKYLGQIAEAEANVEIYLQNPAGIGEHPDVIDAIHSQIQKISEAEDNIKTLKEHFNQHNSIDNN